MDFKVVEAERGNLDGGVGRIEEEDCGGDRKDNCADKEGIVKAMEKKAAARVVHRE